MPTLTDRVLAPAFLDTPTPIGGLVFRPASLDDVAGIHRVLVAACAVDSPRWHPSTEDVVSMLSTTGLDPAVDAIVGVDAGGHVQAYGVAAPVPSRETLVRVVVDGGVHPDHRGRGIGRSVLAWELARGRQQLAASGVDLPGILEVTEQAGAPALNLAARFGLEPLRYWIEMERDLAEPVDVPELPGGFTMRACTTDDIDALLVAKNDSFRDHWGSQPMVPADWHRFLEASTSRLDLSRLVLDADGTVVAFAIVDVDPEAFAARGHSYGYVHWVGTVRAARGRGLAPVVLGASLGAIRADGLSSAILDVDAENPSGALGLYERLGFVRGETAITVALQY